MPGCLGCADPLIHFANCHRHTPCFSLSAWDWGSECVGTAPGWSRAVGVAPFWWAGQMVGTALKGGWPAVLAESVLWVNTFPELDSHVQLAHPGKSVLLKRGAVYTGLYVRMFHYLQKGTLGSSVTTHSLISPSHNAPPGPLLSCQPSAFCLRTLTSSRPSMSTHSLDLHLWNWCPSLSMVCPTLTKSCSTTWPPYTVFIHSSAPLWGCVCTVFEVGCFHVSLSRP